MLIKLKNQFCVVWSWEYHIDGTSKCISHVAQLTPDYINRAFSKVRDEVDCCDHVKLNQKPTFHEIRALAAHILNINGVDPQSRVADSDAKSTKISIENHIKWVEVPLAEIDTGNWWIQIFLKFW